MKKNLLYLFLVLFLFAYPALAQTNTATNAPITLKGELAHAQQLVATNASQIMVEILTGVKNEGGKIYTGTKEALGQAYESVKRETPEVIREFMLWRMVHHGVWIGVFVAIAGIAFYWSRRMKKFADDCPPATYTGGYYRSHDDHGKGAYRFLQYLLVAVCSLLLLTGVTTNLYPMLKIAVAPRVYIIEYVVNAVQSYQQSPVRR